MEPVADLLIIGGGINGAGIARDAAGRGLDVVLCEKSDLASGTSSASTKLIHGGLRYLEYYEFRLVREALIEREVLLRSAPHIIWPMRFILPHHRGLRPAAVLRLGLFLYDHLGGRELLADTRSLNLRRDPLGDALKDDFTKGFEYSDCWVDDARLVVLNALDAAEHGARIFTQTRVCSARRVDGVWEAELEGPDGARRVQRARGLVNAAGPWVEKVLDDVTVIGTRAESLRLVKGSHIVTRRLFEGDRSFIFQNEDGRIGFAIPYERKFTLIGTTDMPYEEGLDRVHASSAEIEYLCELVNEYLREPVTPADVVWSFSGVRPLYDDATEDASAVTRDYVLHLDPAEAGAPLLSVYGGKITTFRRLAEQAMEQMLSRLGVDAEPWTAKATLPGGDMPNADFRTFREEVAARWEWLPVGMLARLTRAYGTRVEKILGNARCLADLGRDFGGRLHEAELDYLRSAEWATCANDVLWRRSKLGLHVPVSVVTELDRWFEGGSASIAPVRTNNA